MPKPSCVRKKSGRWFPLRAVAEKVFGKTVGYSKGLVYISDAVVALDEMKVTILTGMLSGQGMSGGSLAALAGTFGDVAALEDLTMGNAEQSSRVQAVVDWFGPIYFSTMDAEFAALGVTPVGVTSQSGSPESAYIAGIMDRTHFDHKGWARMSMLFSEQGPASYCDVGPCFVTERLTLTECQT